MRPGRQGRSNRRPEPLHARWLVQAEGPHVTKLHTRPKVTRVAVCAVPMTMDGHDVLGRYHGRTGVALYAVEIEGEITFARLKKLDVLRTKYPAAKIVTANVGELNKWHVKSRTLWDAPSQSRGASMSSARSQRASAPSRLSR